MAGETLQLANIAEAIVDEAALLCREWVHRKAGSGLGGAAQIRSWVKRPAQVYRNIGTILLISAPAGIDIVARTTRPAGRWKLQGRDSDALRHMEAHVLLLVVRQHTTRRMNVMRLFPHGRYGSVEGKSKT